MWVRMDIYLFLLKSNYGTMPYTDILKIRKKNISYSIDQYDAESRKNEY